MKHPANTMKFFAIAVVTMVMGLIFVGGATAEPEEDYSAVGLVLGYVLLAIGLIHCAVHAVAILMHDHEMWRSTHFTEVTETVD